MESATGFSILTVAGIGQSGALPAKNHFARAMLSVGDDSGPLIVATKR